MNYTCRFSAADFVSLRRLPKESLATLTASLGAATFPSREGRATQAAFAASGFTPLVRISAAAPRPAKSWAGEDLLSWGAAART
jgi:hypothetical protein